MAVLEPLDVEALLLTRMLKLKERWSENDPPAGIAYDVENLEFDPLKINQEVNTYLELMIRDRVNQAARAITLAFGNTTDLDAIASRYPGGVPRLPGETDARYRVRVWLSPNTLTENGTAEAYQFWALTAIEGALRDASVIKVRPELSDNPTITITCLSSGPDPRPTTAQLLEIRRYLLAENRLALTDVVTIQSPKVLHTNYRVGLYLFPGADQTSAVAGVKTKLAALRDRQYWLGVDHTRMAIAAACATVNGVQNAIIEEPAVDLSIKPDWIAVVDQIIVEYKGRME
jgi:phage-related baseplate assembly protein